MNSFVYILRCQYGGILRYYTGMTLRPKERYYEHKNKKCKYTKRYNGYLYIEYLELVPIKNKKEFYSKTRKREKQIKKMGQERKERLIKIKKSKTLELMNKYMD